MLLNNYQYINTVLGRQFGGVTSPLVYIRPNVTRNYYLYADVGPNDAQISRDSFPTGTNPPYSYVLGPKGALVSSTTTISGSGDISGSVAMGRALAASIAGVGGLTVNASLIIKLASILAGTGALSASLKGAVSLASTLAGSGSLVTSVGLIAKVVSVLTGSGAVTTDLRGKASVSATIYVNSGTATTNEIAAAVWNSLAASFNTAGTMGNKMNAAGSAGDPWSTILPGSYTGSQAGAIVAQIDEILTGLDEVKGAGFDTLKHNLKKIKEAAQEAADLSA